MEHNGSMMFGHTTHGNWLGRNWIALDTYQSLERGTQPPWLATSCISTEAERKKERIWVILPLSESRHDAGTPSRTWVHRRHLAQVIA